MASKLLKKVLKAKKTITGQPANKIIINPEMPTSIREQRLKLAEEFEVYLKEVKDLELNEKQLFKFIEHAYVTLCENRKVYQKLYQKAEDSELSFDEVRSLYEAFVDQYEESELTPEQFAFDKLNDYLAKIAIKEHKSAKTVLKALKEIN